MPPTMSDEEEETREAAKGEAGDSDEMFVSSLDTPSPLTESTTGEDEKLVMIEIMRELRRLVFILKDFVNTDSGQEDISLDTPEEEVTPSEITDTKSSPADTMEDLSLQVTFKS